MRDRLLGYYERELSFLRQMGAEFSSKYPKIASRLLLEPDRCEDPHVERLLEGVAFLSARIRSKLDDDLPEITDSLLGILYPHYLAPVPSMSIVQFSTNPDDAQLGEATRIDAGVTLTTQPVDGVRCRFRTAYPVDLWPVDVGGCSVETPPTVNPLPSRRTMVARTMVRVGLRAGGDKRFAELEIPKLRFFLEAEDTTTFALYETLVGGQCHVELHSRRPSGERSSCVLPEGAIRAVGFDADEMLLPYPARSFRGYCLLQEYFCFPRKFLFVDISGFERAKEIEAGEEMELRIFSDRPLPQDVVVPDDVLQLGCTPIVNLFEKLAEPITVDHLKHDYLVVPDVHAPTAHEVYSVDSVVGFDPDRSEARDFEPFYGFRHTYGADERPVFWHSTRRSALDGATDVHLSMLDTGFLHTSPAVETLNVRATCTNRDLPAALPFSGRVGADFQSEDAPSFVRIRCLGKPTEVRRLEPGRGVHWRLISHLSLNYLSLVEQGADALRGLLELYDFENSAATQKQIAGLVDVRSERIVRSVGGAFSRGRKVTIELDEEAFVGAGPYLFSSVLDVFLGLYCAINSFTMLVARTSQRQEPLGTWQPRAGAHALL